MSPSENDILLLFNTFNNLKNKIIGSTSSLIIYLESFAYESPDVLIGSLRSIRELKGHKVQ